MQEVDGFADQQDLEGRERDDLSNQRGSRVCQHGQQTGGCACVRTLRACSMVKKDGIIDFLREYLSCHRRSVFTFGSDATKNCTRTHKVGRFTFPRVNEKNRLHCFKEALFPERVLMKRLDGNTCESRTEPAALRSGLLSHPLTSSIYFDWPSNGPLRRAPSLCAPRCVFEPSPTLGIRLKRSTLPPATSPSEETDTADAARL